VWIRTLLGFGLFLLGACQDYRLNSDLGSDTAPEGSELGPGGGSGWPVIDGESCNGLDDDGDGDVDEGFPDTDQDGIADCLDETCDVVTPSGFEVDRDRSCAADGGLAVPDPWNLVEQWSWRGVSTSSSYRNAITPPMVGSLTDDNGDGQIDEEDDPDVVLIAWADEIEGGGYLVALDGVTGLEHWAIPGILSTGGVALADVDSDGRTDVVAFDLWGHPVMVNGDGTMVWRAEKSATAYFPQVTVADLEGDGVVDVIADTMRVRGTDGVILNWYVLPSLTEFRMPAVGDVDQDGVQEVILANALFEADGTRLWTAPIQGIYGHWAALLDADGDSEGEIAMVAAGRLMVLEPDGTVLVDVEAGNDHPGAPCVADFDGDGQAEIAWSSNNQFNLYDLDGTVVWSRVVQDETGLLAACSGFDFDGDGSMEIVYSDNMGFYIFDGETGAVHYSNLAHASTTIWEYPTIADLDGDGSAEIVVASNNAYYSGWAGITVFSHSERQWMVSAPNWHVHDYAVTNIEDSGRVPLRPTPSWQVYNTYRARPAKNELAVDLQVAIIDACFSGCRPEARARFSVQAYNTGTNNSATGVSVALYANYGGLFELLEVVQVPERIATGMAADAIVFDVAVGDLGPDGVMVRVDDDGSGGQLHLECDEDNNEWLYADSPCP